MENNNDVNLRELRYNELVSILNMIESDSDLKDTFGGGANTRKRLANSGYSALIRNKIKPVGFIMVVYNERTSKYEIDMGVLKEHRNKGYGTRALDLLRDIILRENVKVEVQVKKTNVQAIKSVIKNGFVLCRQDKLCNYYTIKEDSKQIR